MRKPKFTIAVPVYNKKQFLPKLLVSISKQTFTDYEILFVNDESTDGSREFLEGYAMKFPNRIRLVNNPKNMGLSSTRNALIANSMGDYIVFVDPDDYLDYDLLKVLTEYTERDVDLIKFQMNVHNDGAGKDTDRFTYEAIPDSISGEEALDYFSGDHNKRYAVACTMCYKREFLERTGIRFPDGLRLHEDVAFIPIAIANATTFAMTDYRGYNYVRNDQSLTGVIRAEEDPIKKVEAITGKLRAFDEAINYAMVGVANAPISKSIKNKFFADMISRRADVAASCLGRTMEDPNAVKKGDEEID